MTWSVSLMTDLSCWISPQFIVVFAIFVCIVASEYNQKAVKLSISLHEELKSLCEAMREFETKWRELLGHTDTKQCSTVLSIRKRAMNSLLFTEAVINELLEGEFPEESSDIFRKLIKVKWFSRRADRVSKQWSRKIIEFISNNDQNIEKNVEMYALYQDIERQLKSLTSKRIQLWMRLKFEFRQYNKWDPIEVAMCRFDDIIHAFVDDYFE